MDSENNTGTNDVYFAAHEDPKRTASVALQKGQTFFNYLQRNNYLDKLRKMYHFYYGNFNKDYSGGHEITFTGEQGELVNLPVNHFRNIGQNILNMITANRPLMEGRAINTDYKSLAQTHIANGILDYYMREKGLESEIRTAAEMSIVLGSAFIKMEWNATAGEKYEYDEITGETTYEGEMEFSTLSPLDVVVDGTKEKWSKEWVIVRTFHNKYNLAAKYPDYKEKILGLRTKDAGSVFRMTTFSNDQTDDVPVYEFFHEKCDALPNGRYMLFASDEIILMDMDLPYRQVPIYRIAPSSILGTPYGYSPLFDLFPIQEAINTLYSILMTNNNALGVQNLWVPKGSGINLVNLGGGMNVIEGDMKPEPLQLTASSPETYKLLDELIRAMETVSGVNSVARGQPPASLESGTALALIQSMALQFMSGLQQSYIKLIEDVGTGLIQILKDYASTPKTIALIGKNNRSMVKEFTGDSISAINRVVVDVGNPLSRTIAGRVQMAEQMMQMQVIKNPQDYFTVMETGRLDSMYDGEMQENLNIKRENEMFLEGENPLVSPLDSHRNHIMEHRSVLSDPDLRSNPDLVELVMQHIADHMEKLRNTDPDLLAMVGEQALAPVGANQPQGGVPGGDGLTQPTKGSIEGSPMGDIMAGQSGQPGPNEQATGEPVQDMVPNPAKPPKPFENNPTNPADIVPQ